MQAGGKAFDAVFALLVDHHHFVAEIAAMAAIFLRHGRAEQARCARLVPEFAFDLAVLAPFQHTFFGRVLLVELADRVREDRDLLVLHIFGLGYVDDGHAYFPFQFGLRFSAKAAAPSRASSLTKTGPISCACLS